MTEENKTEIQVKGEYTVLDGGRIKIKGLSSIQFDTIMALLRSWNSNT